jgi:anti-anti-sigma factor
MIEVEGFPSSVVVCRPSGDMEIKGWVTLRRLISDLFQPGLNVLIDLRHVDHVDAVGVSALVDSVRLVQSAGGATRIENANTRVRWRLKLVGADPFCVDWSGTLCPNVA